MKINELQMPVDELFSDETIKKVIDIVVNNRWKDPVPGHEYLRQFNERWGIANDE